MLTPTYMDYSSTTPVDARVAKKMAKYLTMEGDFGNAASRSHYFGWQAEKAVDENIDLRRCHGSKDCNRGKQCLSHHLWCEVSDQIRGFLSTRNLQQVMDDYQLTQSLNVN